MSAAIERESYVSRLGDSVEAADGRVLVVDDEPWVRDIIARWLRAEHLTCDVAQDGSEAIEMLRQRSYSLLVSDIMMPGLSGLDLLSLARKHFPDLAVVMVTAVSDRKTAVETLKRGAYGYVIKPLDQNEVLISVANAMERRRLTKLSDGYAHELEQEVKARTAEIRRREIEVAMRLVAAAEHRDEETGAHVRRIGEYAAVMARQLGWSEGRIGCIGTAAAMHDVGKIGIPDHILLKPGRLTAEEFGIMKQHAVIGAEILGGSDIPLLQMAEEIARSHHEKWDGSGYPDGLSGTQIPVTGRLVAVIDVYDSLVHDRVYRKAMSEEKTLSIIADTVGTHFDPEMHRAFLAVLPELRVIRQRLPEPENVLSFVKPQSGALRTLQSPPSASDTPSDQG